MLKLNKLQNLFLKIDVKGLIILSSEVKYVAENQLLRAKIENTNASSVTSNGLIWSSLSHHFLFKYTNFAQHSWYGTKYFQTNNTFISSKSLAVSETVGDKDESSHLNAKVVVVTLIGYGMRHEWQ